MAVDIDKSAAMSELMLSFARSKINPSHKCPIKGTIDLVMNGKNCLTYRYIMFTALLAKATDESVDILSLQASDESTGAYDARFLCARVVYPFQQRMLGNILDGSNPDPLVNKPARYPRLRKSNKVAGGDPKLALLALCDDLPRVKTSVVARRCMDYVVTGLLEASERRKAEMEAFESQAEVMDVFQVRNFMSDLLDQGFGGASLVLVASSLYKLRFPDDSYEIRTHPVNQSGSSSRQYSDLDVLRGGEPFLGVELKDKPFTADAVAHAAEVAHAAGAKSLLFVAGRQSSFASQPPTYFNDARRRYSRLGMYVGVTSIDDLIDSTLSEHVEVDPRAIMSSISDTAELIGAIEAQIWIYQHASG